ncbi:MAG: DNA-directed RNA polymerase subunit alpha, partial [Patescibacteria group bacterium]
PCYSGYGMTLGNSLRRVLLSSLPGAAVIGVKIKGADHEFMALPHVKEDVLEIILNLKKLRLKIFSEEEIKLELDVHGKKQVKAGDIVKNADVKIENPELVLANITDMAGSLNAEIYVSQGRGYRPVENIEKENREIGYIEMDSVFSPVLSVSVKVENTRVGKMTNWDKLILDIVTDGTISPKESFEQSTKILIEQFSSLLGKKEEVKAEEKVSASEEEPEDEKSKKKKGRPKKSE